MKKIYEINKVRTNNFKDENIVEKITKLWQDAFAYPELPTTIRYGIYTNYESDYQGDYDLIIACNNNLNNFKEIIIPKQKYLKYVVDNIENNGVYLMWTKIWKENINRSYLFDYEEYLLDNSCCIYIGVYDE